MGIVEMKTNVNGVTIQTERFPNGYNIYLRKDNKAIGCFVPLQMKNVMVKQDSLFNAVFGKTSGMIDVVDDESTRMEMESKLNELLGKLI